MSAQRHAPEPPFRLEEATIEALHAAITSGQTTCGEVMQHDLARVRPSTGVASLLVTPDGAPIPEATGAVRAQAPLRCPISTGTRGRPSNAGAWRRRPPIRPCPSNSG